MIKEGKPPPEVHWPFRELKPGSDEYFEVPPGKRSSVSSQATRLKKTEGMVFRLAVSTDKNGRRFLGCWRVQ